MKTIKKVAVTPVTPNTGDIIDSFNTTDDKHTNAPSINAVEQKLNDLIETKRQRVTAISTNKHVEFLCDFYRSANVVTISVWMNVPANFESGAEMVTINIPDWAKRSTQGTETMDNQFINGGFSTIKDEYNNYNVISTLGAMLGFSRTSNGEYLLRYSYLNTNPSSEPQSHRFFLKYMVF